MKKVFISHDTEDKDLVKSFKNNLLEHIGLKKDDIFCASDFSIGSGKQWLDTIKKELIEAEIVIFIITQNFLESKFCMYELGAAWIRESHVIPLIVDPAAKYKLGELLKSMQYIELNDDSLDFMLDEFVKYLDIEKPDSSSWKRWNDRKKSFLKEADEYIKNNPFVNSGGYVSSYKTTVSPDFLREIEMYIKRAKSIKMVGLCLKFFDNKELLSVLVKRTKKNEAKAILCFGDPNSQAVIDRKNSELESKLNQQEDHINEGYLDEISSYIKKHEGKIEVKVFNNYYLEFATLIFDNDIFVYPYGYKRKGSESPVFHFKNNTDEANFFVVSANNIIDKGSREWRKS